jgi:hypothetical protein
MCVCDFSLAEREYDYACYVFVNAYVYVYAILASPSVGIITHVHAYVNVNVYVYVCAISALPSASACKHRYDRLCLYLSAHRYSPCMVVSVL